MEKYVSEFLINLAFPVEKYTKEKNQLYLMLFPHFCNRFKAFVFLKTNFIEWFV